jgi:murein DD-endopeptidase MepM/ murein hydrolase activator NlpD
VHLTELGERLKRLAARVGKLPPQRRSVAAVTLGLVAGITLALAILVNQPLAPKVQPGAWQEAAQQQVGDRPTAGQPASPAMASLPLARIERRPLAKLPPPEPEAPRQAIALPLTRVSVEAARPAIIQRTVAIARGDTLMAVMTRSGSDRKTAHAAIQALSKVYNPRRLRPGQELTLLFDPRRDAATEGSPGGTDASRPPLVQLAFTPSVEQEILVSLNDQGRFVPETIERPLKRRLHRADANIDDALYLAAKRAGMPAQMIVELIRLYSFDVDFQRDVQPGDRFEVLFEAFYDERGELAKYGDILYAQLHVKKTDLPLYRFVMKDGNIDYFNNKGHSVRKALMKTPVDGARLTSRFGSRRHPILGYRKMHRGIDFGAPRGTPVLAAGSGVVESAGWNGGYGRYLRIRHNGRYKTAYAHLKAFRRGIKRGKRVKQGQIVAYVGSTGRSTGPHLHYEILVDGRRINPLGLKLPTGKKLKGKELARFQGVRGETAKQFAATTPLTRLADRR